MSGDTYWNNVHLLIQGTGNDGSQVFSDSSSYNKTITVYNQTKMSNTQQLFGQNTIYFDGAGDTLRLAASSSWQMNVNDPFTLECWFFLPTGNTRTNYLLNCATPTTDYQFIFRVNGTTGITPYNKLSFLIYQLEVSPYTRDTINSDDDVTRNAWHHAAISYDGTNYYLGLDGVVKTQARTVSSYATTTSRLYIGASELDDNSFSIQGFMQDIRITKGVARYTTTYTPPIALLPIGPESSGPSLPPNFRVVPIKQNYSHFYRHL